MSDDLKACPFCSGRAFVHGDFAGTQDPAEIAIIKCVECGVETDPDPLKKAREIWNRRPPWPVDARLYYIGYVRGLLCRDSSCRRCVRGPEALAIESIKRSGKAWSCHPHVKVKQGWKCGGREELDVEKALEEALVVFHKDVDAPKNGGQDERSTTTANTEDADRDEAPPR